MLSSGLFLMSPLFLLCVSPNKRHITDRPSSAIVAIKYEILAANTKLTPHRVV